MSPAPSETAQELYDAAPCGYASLELGGRLLRANRSFLGWVGLDCESLLERRLADVLTPGGRIYYETHVAPLLALQGAVREIALDLVRADGSRLPVLLNADLVDGGVVRATLFDASQRREYERELLRATRRTERLQQVTAALAEPLAPAEIAAAVLEAVAADTAADTVIVTHDGAPLARAGDAAAAHERFPLVAEHGELGAVELGFADGRPLTPTEAAFVRSVATQCAQALARHLRRAEDARILRATQERLMTLEDGFWHLRKAQEVLPMCMGCRRVRDEAGAWQELHDFLLHNTHFLSHGLCRDCEHVFA